MSAFLAMILVLLAVLSSMLSGAPVWILIMPFLLIQTRGSARMATLAFLGLCIDVLSGHPLLLTIFFPILALGMNKLEIVVERNALFLGVSAMSATVATLLVLVISRLFVAGALNVPIAPQRLLLSVLSPSLLLAILAVSAGVSLFEWINIQRSDYHHLTYG